MVMVIEYSGPPQLKKTVHQICNCVSNGNYERKNPRIICGLPHFFNYKGDLTGQIGFETTKEFNRHVSKKIDKLLDIIERAQMGSRKSLDRRLRTMINEFKKYSFLLQKNPDFRKEASYSIGDDAILIDVFITVVYMVKGEDLKTVRLTSHLIHELAHYDLGLCNCHCDMRNASKAAVDCLNLYHDSTAAVSKGKHTMLKWLKKKGRAEFERLGLFDKYESAGPVAVRMELERYEKEQIRLDQVSNDLGLRVADEAVAYCFENNRDGFVLWIEEDPQPVETEKAVDLYDRIEQKIKAQGKIATLREVKTAMDVSYGERKSMSDLLL
jgi:hypothetical protein